MGIHNKGSPQLRYKKESFYYKRTKTELIYLIYYFTAKLTDDVQVLQCSNGLNTK